MPCKVTFVLYTIYHTISLKELFLFCLLTQKFSQWYKILGECARAKKLRDYNLMWFNVFLTSIGKIVEKISLMPKYM